MSHVGQTQTWAGRFGMSGLPPIADIVRPHARVRFVPQPDSCTATNGLAIQSPYLPQL